MSEKRNKNEVKNNKDAREIKRRKQREKPDKGGILSKIS